MQAGLTGLRHDVRERLIAQRTAAEGLLVPAHDVLFGASLGQWNGADAAVLEHHAAGFIYRSPDDTPPTRPRPAGPPR